MSGLGAGLVEALAGYASARGLDCRIQICTDGSNSLICFDPAGAMSVRHHASLAGLEEALGVRDINSNCERQEGAPAFSPSSAGLGGPGLEQARDGAAGADDRLAGRT